MHAATEIIQPESGEVSERHRRAISTEVQFRYFQRELPPVRPGSSTYTKQDLSQPRAWLSPTLLRLACDPLTVESESTNNEIKQTAWWGDYHYSREVITPAAPMAEPPNLQVSPFRARIKWHDYLWDGQAWPGQKVEVILDRQSSLGEFFPAAALLASEPSSKVQQMVIGGGDTAGWHEPQTSGDILRAQSYLFYLTQLTNMSAKSFAAVARAAAG